MNLWWIPRDRVRELSASDLGVLRMCRVLTVFIVAFIVYFAVIIGSSHTRAERDVLRTQLQRCGCAEAQP
jgi:hypothetical protein